ncbi:MAG: asparaginase domain-containing protein [Arenicella sp.]
MIQVFITGGTIDKHYMMENGKMGFAESHLEKMLKLGRSTVDTELQTLMFKDSLDMDDADRQKIAESCNKSGSKDILISHGTDTMVKTATHIAQHKANIAADKTIVLTGAMIPYKVTHSDALFNLGFALCATQTLQAGIYIAMNGQVFDWDKVFKNHELGKFQAL